jgi:hypothetical protein
MKPLKTQGFAQRLYEQSSTKRETLGRLRFTDDGRAFRYAKAGGTIAAGYVCQGPEGVAEHTVIRWRQGQRMLPCSSAL